MSQYVERPRQHLFQRRVAQFRKPSAQFVHAVALACLGKRYARGVSEISEIWVENPALAIETAETTSVPYIV